VVARKCVGWWRLCRASRNLWVLAVVVVVTSDDKCGGVVVKNNEYQVGCGSGGVGCQVTMSGKGVRQ
jgi:hypothetical protein